MMPELKFDSAVSLVLIAADNADSSDAQDPNGAVTVLRNAELTILIAPSIAGVQPNRTGALLNPTG